MGMGLQLQYLYLFNLTIFVVLTALYLYQVIYVFVALFREKNKEHFNEPAKLQHRYGVIIAARNEELVIGSLIESIHGQTYSADKVDIFVVADNCTDQTADISRDLGAKVYERFSKTHVGKGYALDFIFHKIAEDYGEDYYDGYFIFDADNLLDEHYIEEMNKVFDSGYRVVTSYRNSKNYSTNWITAGYSLWFLREAKYLNNPRMMMNTSCAVSGTGFLLSSEVVRENGGWKYHLLTEDIEFSVASALKGEVIGYCEKAKLYDEQPTTFSQSWTQRLRWAKGFYQVIGKYGADLVKAVFTKKGSRRSCYDLLMTVAPATFVTLLCLGVNLVMLIQGLLNVESAYYLIPIAAKSVLFSFVNCYVMLFFMGGMTTITEWKQIKCSTAKKILYVFTFPLFIFTYIPISIVALFKDVEWKPITHSVVKNVEEMK